MGSFSLVVSGFFATGTAEGLRSICPAAHLTGFTLRLPECLSVATACNYCLQISCHPASAAGALQVQTEVLVAAAIASDLEQPLIYGVLRQCVDSRPCSSCGGVSWGSCGRCLQLL